MNAPSSSIPESGSPIRRADEAGVAEAVRHLRAGEVVGLPTETVYGLGGDAMNPEALAKIFAVKRRPLFDPLILHVSSIDDAGALTTSFSEPARVLAEAFWPGPLTLVLPKAACVPDLATSGLPDVAVRVPAHPVMRAVLAQFGGPIAAPSANRFQSISPTTAQAVAQELGEEVHCILDGGPCAVGLESTIIGWTQEGQPTLLRAGGIPVEAIEALIGPVTRKNHEEPETPLAPGQFTTHYAPKKPLYLFEGPGAMIFELGEGIGDDRAVGLMAFGDTASFEFGADSGGAFHRVEFLSRTGSLVEAAAKFFGSMRALDRDPEIEMIFVTHLPNEGLGLAINDRLRRASSRKPSARAVSIGKKSLPATDDQPPRPNFPLRNLMHALLFAMALGGLTAIAPLNASRSLTALVIFAAALLGAMFVGTGLPLWRRPVRAASNQQNSSDQFQAEESQE